MDLASVTWRRLAYVSSAVLSACIAYSLFHVPFEVGDTLNSLLRVDAARASDIFWSDFLTSGFVRPLTVVTSNLIYETGRSFGAQPFFVYRTVHVVMVALLLAGTVRLLRVTSFLTFALAMLAVATLIGVIPFHEAVHETELNIKLIMATACMMAVVVASSPRRWWSDVAAVALAAYAMFANELGLLVWVCLVAGFIAGFRGVSLRALAIITAFLGLYFYLRFVRLHIGVPELTERSSGYGFSIRNPPELSAMFGAHPLRLYAYNIAASASTVLLSEPSGGVFIFVRDLLGGKATIGMFVNVMSSALTTLAMAWYAVRRCGEWVRGQLTHEDRLFLVAAAVIAANAAISFPYTKDVTMIPAAAFYPLAMFGALHALVRHVTMRPVRVEHAVAVCALLTVISIGWSIRAVSFYADMRLTSYKAQTDWVFLDDWLRNGQLEMAGPGQRAMVDRLRAEMLGMTVPKVYLDPPWVSDLLTRP